MKPDIECRTCSGKGYHVTVDMDNPEVKKTWTCDQCDGSGISVRYNPYPKK